MTPEPLSAYVRRMNGHPEMSWDEISARIAGLEAEVERLRAELAEIKDSAGRMDGALCRSWSDDVNELGRLRAVERALRTTLVAIVNTRDGELDNVWQRLARAALNSEEGT